MYNLLSRPTGRQRRVVAALLAVMLLLAQGFSAVPGSRAWAGPQDPSATPIETSLPAQGDQGVPGTAQPVQMPPSESTVPAPAAGEKPSFDYGDLYLEPLTTDQPQGAKPAPGSSAPVPAIKSADFGPKLLTPGATVNYTYTVQVAFGTQTFIMRSAIRGLDGVWVTDTAHDRQLTLKAGIYNAVNFFAIPEGIAPGTYDAAWTLWNADYSALYSYSLGTGSVILAPAAPKPTSTPASTRTSTATATRTFTRTATRTSTATRTNTSLPATITPTRTNTAIPPTVTTTRTFTPVPPTFTNTRVPTNTNTPTVTNTSPPTNTNTPVPTFTFTPAPPTNTPTPTDTVPPGVTRTATPSSPVLVDVAAAPSVAAPGTLVTLSYTVFSPAAQQVSLGAGMKVNGTANWFYDAAHDATVSVAAGTNVVTRLFALPAASGVTYDVIWGLWSPGFVTQYGLMQRDAAVTTSGSTPTPSAPNLVDVAFEPDTAFGGSTIVLSYTVFSPIDQQLSLGAAISSGGAWLGDPANDRTLAVTAGTSVVTRSYNLGSNPAGTYSVRWGLWSAGFGTQYGDVIRAGVLTILPITATPAPTNTPTNTPTATNTPPATATYTATATSTTPTATPTVPVLVSVSAGPSTTAPGTSVVLTYTVFSPAAQQVSLGAGMRVNGSGGNWFYDGANDRTLGINAGMNTVTRLFTVPNTPNVTYDVIWGLWSAGFGTQYGGQSRDAVITVNNSATPTPVVPTLLDVAFEPGTAFRGGTIVLTYTLYSPIDQQVGLGAGIAPNSTTNWVSDVPNDRAVAVTAGNNVVTRTYNLGANPAGLYSIQWGLWNGTFTTQYAGTTRTGVLTIVDATATPTLSPTFTDTPGPGTPSVTPTNTTVVVAGTPTNTPQSGSTPTVPTLLSVSVSPATVSMGGTAILTFNIFSPTANQYVLGALIRNSAVTYDDPGNNILLSVPAGSSTVTRQFYVRTDDSAGTYDVLFGLWSGDFSVEYASQSLTAALRVVSATPTATVLVATPTSTAIPAPAGAVTITGISPAAGQTFNIGSTITLNYTVNNTTGAPLPIRLVASIAPSGMSGYGTITDAAHEVTVTALAGTNLFSRQFLVPMTAGEGSYDLTWSLFNASNSLLSSLTSPNHMWIKVTGSTTGLVSFTGTSLNTNSITLAPGIVNRITGIFNVDNSTGSSAQVILRMRIKATNSQNWVTDLMSDNLISVPNGASTVSRGFAIPRYLPSGNYDVVWELGDPSFTGTLDSVTGDGVLQITNPARIANTGIPVLMYHNVNPTTAGGNWVSVTNFTQQMDYLATHNWHTILGDDIYNYVYKGTALPANPIWLTFDDSYQNIYNYALPIMQARGLKGSIFTVTQYMGQMNSWDLCCEQQHLHMTWSMMQALRDAGFALDSHTQHHVRLQESTDAQQQAEIYGTQRDLNSFAGQAAASFCYPYGQFNETTKWMVAHSGFRSATAVQQVKQYTDYSDIYEVTRIGIADTDTLTNFVSKITGP